MLGDDSFNAQFQLDREYLDYTKPMPLTEEEPLFDAADVLRIGKDIFMRRGVTSNDAGFRWLQRHLGCRHRVHRIEFEANPYNTPPTPAPTLTLTLTLTLMRTLIPSPTLTLTLTVYLILTVSITLTC